MVAAGPAVRLTGLPGPTGGRKEGGRQAPEFCRNSLAEDTHGVTGACVMMWPFVFGEQLPTPSSVQAALHNLLVNLSSAPPAQGRFLQLPMCQGSSVPTCWAEKSPQSVGPGQRCLMLPVAAGAFSPSLFLVPVSVGALQDLWRTLARIDT